MFGKIFVTLVVILACMAVLANRAGSSSRLREIPNPAIEKRKKSLRLAAYAFMAIMLIVAGIMFFLELDSN